MITLTKREPLNDLINAVVLLHDIRTTDVVSHLTFASQPCGKPISQFSSSTILFVCIHETTFLIVSAKDCNMNRVKKKGSLD
jgi:hypothetical protein